MLEAEHLHKLDKLLTRLKVKRLKCSLEVVFLAHKYSSVLHPVADNLQAIQEALVLINITKLNTQGVLNDWLLPN